MKLTRRQSLNCLAAAATVRPGTAAARPNPLPAIRLVALDMGGTIIEDRGDIPSTLQSALANHGVSSTPAEISQWRGASKREMVRHFVDRQTLPVNTDRDSLTNVIYEEFTARIIAIYRTVPPIAGAEDAIRQLSQRGYLLATTTGFDKAITRSILSRLGWEHYFAAMVSSDEVAQGRPAPYMLFHAMEAARVNSVAEVMAVGDTPLDLQAGTNAGLRAVVGVLSGVSKAENLEREPHTHILPSVAGLPALLASKL